MALKVTSRLTFPFPCTNVSLTNRSNERSRSILFSSALKLCPEVTVCCDLSNHIYVQSKPFMLLHSSNLQTPMPRPRDISTNTVSLRSRTPLSFRAHYTIGLLLDALDFPGMLLHVPFQVVSSLKLSFAHLTCEFGTLMILLMFVVVCRVSCFVIAEIAFVFLIASVDSLVAV